MQRLAGFIAYMASHHPRTSFRCWAKIGCPHFRLRTDRSAHPKAVILLVWTPVGTCMSWTGSSSRTCRGQIGYVCPAIDQHASMRLPPLITRRPIFFTSSLLLFLDAVIGSVLRNILAGFWIIFCPEYLTISNRPRNVLSNWITGPSRRGEPAYRSRMLPHTSQKAMVFS